LVLTLVSVAACGIGNGPYPTEASINLGKNGELWIPASADAPEVVTNLPADVPYPLPDGAQHVGDWYEIEFLFGEPVVPLTLSIDTSSLSDADRERAFLAMWDSDEADWVIDGSATRSGNQLAGSVTRGGVYGLFISE